MEKILDPTKSILNCLIADLKLNLVCFMWFEHFCNAN